MYPHDYYDHNGHPELHNRRGGRPYIEPDFMASECDDQLPIVSTIGRGPRGRGVTFRVKDQDADTLILEMVDDVTGEAFYTTPNLSAGQISFSQPSEVPDDGEPWPLDIHVTRGNEYKTYSVMLPPGAHGSRVYVLETPVANMSKYNVFQCTVADLVTQGAKQWGNKPDPRIDDLVVCTHQDEDGVLHLCFADVVAVEEGQVVCIAKDAVSWEMPYIDGQGHWVVNGKPTLVSAKGPKGDKGDDGDKGDKGDPGDPGAPGADGGPGDPAVMEIGETETLAPGEDATVEMTALPGNRYRLEFGVPEGAKGDKGDPGDDGKSINIQPGVYRIATLPVFEDTPVNNAYVVDDDDGRQDLYIRGEIAVVGTAWTIVENWQGAPGADAGFGDLAASIQEDGGEPSVTVMTSGPNTAKNISFLFKNIEGDRLPEDGEAGQFLMKTETGVEWTEVAVEAATVQETLDYMAKA